MLRLSEDVVNAGVDAIVDMVDGGSGSSGEIHFYEGSPPESINGTPVGALLVAIEYEDPAFSSASSGVASINGAPLQSVGLSNGTIGFARVVNTDGVTLWDDSDVGTDASNSITVNTLTVSENVDFEITSHTFGIHDDTAS